MPFTPFHFGLGYGLAAAERRPTRFCFLAFVLTQVVIDTETLLNMARGAPRLHTFFHSFAGSLVAALVSFAGTFAVYSLGARGMRRLPGAAGKVFAELRFFP